MTHSLGWKADDRLGVLVIGHRTRLNDAIFGGGVTNGWLCALCNSSEIPMTQQCHNG
jgi:hypothetical protein